MIKVLVAGALALTLTSGVADSRCQQGSAPPPSVGHNPDHAGQPDPVPHAPTPSRQVRQLRFTIEASVATVATWNAGHGNKFLENVKFEVWYAASYVGATAYLGALPAKRDTQG